MRKYIVLLAILVSLSQGYLCAQDPIYSQFYAAPLQINPAFTGITSAPRISFNYRNQYPNWPNAYLTYAVAYEQNVEALNSGFGLMLMSDSEGDGVYKTHYASGFYGYRVRFGPKLYARFGLEAGLMQTTVDWDRLVFGDQIDPITGPVGGGGTPNQTEEERPSSLRSTVFDVSAGLLIYGGPFYGGLSLKHLNTPDPSILLVNDNLRTGRPMRVTVHAGAEFPLGRGNKSRSTAFISPNLLLARQGDFTQLNVGAYVGFGQFFSGLWFRHAFGNPDAAIFALGFREGAFRIGYSYDLTVSQLSSVPGGGGGAHEISLTINLGDSEAVKKRQAANRWNDCFNMFR